MYSVVSVVFLALCHSDWQRLDSVIQTLLPVTQIGALPGTATNTAETVQIVQRQGAFICFIVILAMDTH